MPSKNAVRLILFMACLVATAILAGFLNRGSDASAPSPESSQTASNEGDIAASDHAHHHGGEHQHEHGDMVAEAPKSGQTSAPNTPHAAGHDHAHPAVPAATLARIAKENPQLAASTSTSSDGLKESPLPSGGFKVNLEGRFHSVAVATIGADGKVGFTCVADIGLNTQVATNAAQPTQPDQPAR